MIRIRSSQAPVVNWRFDMRKEFNGYTVIYRMSFRTKSGRVIRSKTGRPFPIKVKKDKEYK